MQLTERLTEPCGIAQALEVAEREHLINKQLKKYSKLVNKLSCYNCDEPLTIGLNFCDGDCRDDYDHRITRGKLYVC